jgi:hypothetical protein
VVHFVKDYSGIQEVDLILTEFHSEFYGWFLVIHVIEELMQFFETMLPYHKNIIYVSSKVERFEVIAV